MKSLTLPNIAMATLGIVALAGIIYFAIQYITHFGNLV